MSPALRGAVPVTIWDGRTTAAAASRSGGAEHPQVSPPAGVDDFN